MLRMRVKKHWRKILPDHRERLKLIVYCMYFDLYNIFHQMNHLFHPLVWRKWSCKLSDKKRSKCLFILMKILLRNFAATYLVFTCTVMSPLLFLLRHTVRYSLSQLCTVMVKHETPDRWPALFTLLTESTSSTNPQDRQVEITWKWIKLLSWSIIGGY